MYRNDIKKDIQLYTGVWKIIYLINRKTVHGFLVEDPTL